MPNPKEQHNGKGGGRKVKGFLFKRGGVWIAGWTAFGKRNRRSTGIKCGKQGSKEAAEAKLAEFVAPYKASDEADVRAALVRRQRAAEEVAEEKRLAALAEVSRIPLADAWGRHPYDTSQTTRGRSAVHPLSARNVRENEYAWQKFVQWAEAKHGAEFEKRGGIAMQDVSEDWAREYSKDLQKEGLTPSRHNVLLLVCNVMYRLAQLPSPFANVPKLTKQQAEHREPFTKEQVARLLAAASGEWKGFLAALYYLGLRAGDAVNLTHEMRRDGRFHVETAKTGSRVAISIHPELDAILAEVAPPKKRGFLFPKLAAAYARNTNILSSRFKHFAANTLAEYSEDENGERMREAFDGTAERKHGVRRISRQGLHAFRHSFAAANARAGTPLEVTQTWLGHSSPEITRIYSHYGTAAEQARVMAAVSLGDAKEPAFDSATPANVAEVAKLLAGADAKTLAKVQALLAEKGGAK